MNFLLQMTSQLYDLLHASFWVFNGLAHGLVVYIIGKLILYGYHEHAYLYQFSNRSKAVDNAVQLLLPYVKKIKANAYRQFLETILSQAGTRNDWTTDHFMASQILYAIICLVCSYVMLNMILGISFLLTLMLTVFAASLPLIKIMEIANLRYVACTRDLPFFIDYLALSMGAGLDFNKGLDVVISDAPNSPLKDEFSLVVRNMNLGMSREEALLEMQRRMNSPGLGLFVQTLVQAIKMGTDVATTLVVISETLQGKRFQIAEEKAGKISVKMMIPMMVFVMPSTMIILLGPMILEWLDKSV